jgi:hypothetical protein
MLMNYRRACLVVFTVGLAVAILLWLKQPIDGNPDAFKQGTTQSVVLETGLAIEHWMETNNHKPPDAGVGLSALHLKTAARDGWGNALIYKPQESGSPHPFELYSLGPSGMDKGGAGDNVSYWDVKKR